MKYIIGIDTGGTYTDGIIMEKSTKRIINYVKVPTTHYDIGKCIYEVTKTLLDKTRVDSNNIEDIAISTTLATNSVVEGKGANVTLFMIGLMQYIDLPVVETIYVQGGHKWTGEEEEPLNLEGLTEALYEVKDRTEAYAVVANMSFVNPTHELVTAEAIRLIDPKPMVLSHQLSTRAGMKERAATCVFNARLTPIMENFIKKTREQLINLGLKAKMHIIKGDGTIMDIDEAIRRPVDTISSGPAASAVYGQFYLLNHTNYSSALIIDIGGTTTDIAAIIDRKLLINQTGNVVDKWQTHTYSIETQTIGIGGDSQIKFYNKDTITIGPLRVKPIGSVLFEKFIEFILNNNIYECYIVSSNSNLSNFQSTSELTDVLNCINETPFFTINSLHDLTKIDKNKLDTIVNKLLKLNIIEKTSLTPTDILSYLNIINLGKREIVEIALNTLSKTFSISIDEICDKVKNYLKNKITNGIIEYLLKIQFKDISIKTLNDLKSSKYINCRFSINMPIIAIGAASKALLQEVDRELATEIVYPEYYEVGNAIGAALLV